MHFLWALSLLLGYLFIFAALVPVLLRAVFKMPREMTRKTQHIVIAFSVFFYTDVFATYTQALIGSTTLMMLGFVGLWLFEKTPQYQRWLHDRKPNGGEMKHSLIQVQVMFAILIVLFGILLPSEKEDIILISVMAWGFGDALAAVIGKRFGRRKNVLPGADHKKTIVGSQAMFLSAFIVISVSLFMVSPYVWWLVLLVTLVVASVATLVEAYAKKGFDTMILPLSVAFSLYGLMVIIDVIGVV